MTSKPRLALFALTFMYFASNLAGCRSLGVNKLLGDNDKPKAAAPEGLWVKNTLAPISSDASEISVTDAEIEKIHAIGLDNNHSYSIKDLTKGFKDAKGQLHLIYVARGEAILSYLILQNISVPGSNFMLVHDAGFALEALEDEEVLERTREEIRRTRKEQSKRPMAMVKSNIHYHPTEFIQKLKFTVSTEVGGTVAARDTNTGLVRYDIQTYVNGEIPSGQLSTIRKVVRENAVLDPDNVETPFDAESYAILADAGLVPAKRKFRARKSKKIIELDRRGTELKREVIQALGTQEVRAPIIIGDAGSGKSFYMSRIWEGMQQGDFNEEAPILTDPNVVFYEIDINLWKKGTEYRGIPERRAAALKAMIPKAADPKKQRRALLFTDEIQDLYRKNNEGLSFAAATLDVQGDGRLINMGMTTKGEFRKYIASENDAFMSRVRVVELESASPEDTYKIIEIYFLDGEKVEGVSKREMAEIIYHTFSMLRPSGQMRDLKSFTEEIAPNLRAKKLKAITKENFEQYVRERFKLPKNFQIPDRAFIAKTRSTVRTAVLAQYGTQVNDSTLDTVDNAVLGTFFDDRASNTNFIVAPSGSGRTSFVKNLADLVGRNHVVIKLGPNLTPMELRELLQKDINDEPYGVGNASAYVSIEGFDNAQKATQDELLSLLNKGSIPITKDGIEKDYSIGNVVVFIETSKDASAYSSYNQIELGPRTTDSFQIMVENFITEEFRANRLYADLQLRPGAAKALAEDFLKRGEGMVEANAADATRSLVKRFLAKLPECDLVLNAEPRKAEPAPKSAK